MKTYVITYDLIREIDSSGYKTLAEAIKQIGDWCRPTESTWVVRSALTADQIYKAIRPKMDSNDQVFICELTRGNWQGAVPRETIATLETWIG